MRSFAGPVALLVALLGCASDPSAGTDTRHLLAEGALGPYSGSVQSGGFCFASGKIGERGGTFEREVNTCIDAVVAELARSGLDLSDVVESTVYLTDIGRYDELNRIYAERFPSPYPARACVQVAALPGRARVEIKVTARMR